MGRADDSFLYLPNSSQLKADYISSIKAIFNKYMGGVSPYTLKGLMRLSIHHLDELNDLLGNMDTKIED